METSIRILDKSMLLVIAVLCDQYAYGTQVCVGLGSSPSPCRVAPSTESQCMPGIGGLSCGHLNSAPRREPPGSPLRRGARPTLITVPRTKLLAVMPSLALIP